MLPTKLKAGGLEFNIEYKDFVDYGKRGRLYFEENRMTIKNGQCPQVQNESITHETLHIAEIMAGLDLEEKYVQSAGLVLFGILRDNPNLFTQNRIKGAGFVYDVIFLDPVDPDGETESVLWIKHDSCQIRIKSGTGPVRAEQLLMYAVLDIIDLILDLDTVQDVKHRLGNWLYTLLKDNPQIWPHVVMGEG